MNGPIILNDAREQLAEKIFAYREPKPAPLKISPWVAMSLLQKAIRRGESEMAQDAAATLLLIAPDRLWRRCGAAAFEEIGVADLQTVSVVTAALEAVCLVVRERVEAAGIDPNNYSGHSLRAGLATSAAQAGVSSWKIRQQTGHSSDAMLSRYIRESELFHDNAASYVL